MRKHPEDSAMTVDQIDKALLRLVARQRARTAEWAMATLEQESKAEVARPAEAEDRLGVAPAESAPEATPDPGFVA
jgi:hypothetical protein